MKTLILLLILFALIILELIFEFYAIYFNKKTLFTALFYFKQFIQFLVLIAAVTLVFIVIYIQYLMK
jgi:hypothetical protein